MSLSGRDLRRMRKTADAHLPSAAEVWRATPTPDDRGGTTQTYARTSTVRCRYAALAGVQASERVYADRLGGLQGWWFTLPLGIDVTLADQLRADGRTFEVVSLDAGRSWDISIRVLTKEVT